MEKLQAPSLRQQTERSNASLEEAAKCAKLLLGCYGKAEVSDPEVFVAGVISVLSRYPVETMRYVVDPYYGVPGKIKWLPKISEIKEACEEHLEATAREVKRLRDLDEQQKRPLMIEDQRERPTYDELKRRCWDAGLKIGPKPRDPHSIAPTLEKYGVTQDAFDAIPDLPKDFELRRRA